MSEPIAAFAKDGVTKYAYTRADVVQLKFDGWQPAEQLLEAERAPMTQDLTRDESGDES